MNVIGESSAAHQKSSGSSSLESNWKDSEVETSDRVQIVDTLIQQGIGRAEHIQRRATLISNQLGHSLHN